MLAIVDKLLQRDDLRQCMYGSKQKERKQRIQKFRDVQVWKKPEEINFYLYFD